MADSRALAVVGYCRAALDSDIRLSSLSFAGDMASVVVFTRAPALVTRNLVR